MIKKGSFVTILLMISLLLASCRNIDITSFKYKLEFMVDGEIYKTVGTDGSIISMPPDPKKENFSFKGWFGMTGYGKYRLQ